MTAVSAVVFLLDRDNTLLATIALLRRCRLRHSDGSPVGLFDRIILIQVKGRAGELGTMIGAQS